jgi:hypothetical protein
MTRHEYAPSVTHVDDRSWVIHSTPRRAHATSVRSSVYIIAERGVQHGA